MKFLSAILPANEYVSKARSFSDLLPYGVTLVPGVVLGKNGSLTASYRYRGGDMESESKADLAETNRRINEAVKRFGPGWALWFHSFREAAPGYPIESDFPDATAYIIDAERRASYEEHDAHYTNEYVVDISYLPPSETTQKAFSFMIEGRPETGSEAAARSALKIFDDALRAFETFLDKDLRLERLGHRTVDGPEGEIVVDDQLSHFIKCATNRDIRVRVAPRNTDLSHVVACAKLRGGFSPMIGDSLIGALTITDLPNSSYPGMFEVLNQMGYEYRATWRFIVRDPDRAMADIKRERGRWFNKRRSASDVMLKQEGRFQNGFAVSMAKDAEIAEDTARSGDVTFGYFTMTIIVFKKVRAGDSEVEAEADLAKTLDQILAQLRRLYCNAMIEDANAIEAFLGSLPALGHAQLRKSMLMSRNLVDFIPTTALWTGSPTAPCSFYPPNSPPLAYVTSTGGTPFNLNVHVGQVGHFLVVGDTGGGKSVLLGFILAQHRRYRDSRQVVFDVGRSHFTLTSAVGGRHYELGAEGGPSLCPLANIQDPAERMWAEGWLTHLCELQGVDPKGAKGEIYKALTVLAHADPPYSLTALTRSPHLSKAVRSALERYTISGNYGGILDGETDTIEDANFLCFEMGSLMEIKDPKISQPVLYYLFRKVERLADNNPMMLLIDEAWTFLENPQAAAQLATWLRVMRKKNVSVGFSTQNVADLTTATISKTLLGSCRTKIYIANPQATSPALRGAYQELGLSSWQINKIARAERMQHYYIVSDEGKRMISLNLKKVSLAFFISDPLRITKIKKLIADERAALAEHPESAETRPPWQAVWLHHHLGEDAFADRWFELYMQAWQARGGFRCSMPDGSNYDLFLPQLTS